MSCSHISFLRDKASFIPYILSSKLIRNENKKMINNRFYCVEIYRILNNSETVKIIFWMEYLIS